MSHKYDQVFMDYTAAASRHAASRVVELLASTLQVTSVLDVGCASGTWLATWRRAEVEDVLGVDGDYVDRNGLIIPEELFQAADLSETLSLGRQFDLVQSLEVAEHIEAQNADRFVANLIEHSRGLILFSAAPPGQGGEHHVNEQPYDYWRRRFGRYGYHVCDVIRPMLAGDTRVPFWYRYNTLLYVHADRLASLPSQFAERVLRTDQPVADISPVLFRVRKKVIALFPISIQQQLARWKARLFASKTL